jgi:ABC-type uncharacterized transport system auxiliary subunit
MCFLWSCGSQKVVATKYYLIEIPMDSIVAAHENTAPIIEKKCEIIPVDINPAYSTTQIANRSSSRAITYYSNHHWAMRPAISFSRLILDYFSHALVFQDVSDRFWRVQPDFHLETTIYHLEVVQEDNILSAHLSLEFRLSEAESSRELIHHSADRYTTLENRDLNLFAKAIGEIFYQELEQLLEQINLKLKDSP